MKKLLLILFLSSTIGLANAQEVAFTVEVSVDSLLMGNTTKVTFTLENAKGYNFKAPDFVDFQIVGGPSQASSFSMINGAITQTQSYAYYLQPLDIGNFFIQPASIETDEGVLETIPIEVLVVPNPDGIEQKLGPKPKRERLNPVPPEKPNPKKSRKKRRIYRI